MTTKTSREKYIIRVTERDLREQVRDVCNLFGWKMYFSWTSIHSPRGFPDLVLANPEQKRVVYAELKSDKGQLTEYQRDWLDTLAACGQEVYVWSPGDIQGIVEILRSPQSGLRVFDGGQRASIKRL